MNRRQFLVSLGVAAVAAPKAWAQSYAEQIVQQLDDQGFNNIQVEVTLLGRVRIMADATSGHREIILNPKTGEILRDIWFDAAGNPLMPRIVGSQGSGSNSGSGSQDDGEGGSGGDGDGDGDGSSGSDGESGSSGSGSDEEQNDHKGDDSENRD